MILIDVRFYFFEGSAKFFMKLIQQNGTEGLSQESIVEVHNTFPRGETSDGDFGKKNVDMRIPLKTASKGMENTNKAGSKALGFVEFAEHAKNNVADGVKKTIEKGTISAEEDAKLLRDGKNAMSVNALNDFERHGGSALDGIEIPTGRAKATFAAKRNEFERTTRRAPIHGSAVRRIPTMNHLIDTLENNRASFKGVLDFFIMI